MAKHKDTRSAGRSRRVPFKPGEANMTRHDRRKSRAMADLKKFEKWCRERGIVLRINNSGHHWQVYFGAGVIEWWPSSAKCVVNKKWTSGVHVHDAYQLRGVIKREWDLA